MLRFPYFIILVSATLGTTVSLVCPFGAESLVTNRTRLFGHRHIDCPLGNSRPGRTEPGGNHLA